MYSINELEQLTGVKAHTLRMWERRYNLLDPQRDERNIRYYHDDDLALLQKVVKLNKIGMRISKIAKLSPLELDERVKSMNGELPTDISPKEALLKAIIQFDEHMFSHIIDPIIAQKGLQQTMHDIIFPLRDKLTMMWMTGSAKAVHDRFLTQLLKRKCCIAIQSCEPHRADTFMVYSPKGELDKLAVLYTVYLVANAGFRTVDVGVDVPFEEITQLKHFCTPRYICFVVNKTMNNTQLELYLGQLHYEFPDSHILVYIQSIAQDISLPDEYHVKFVRTSEDVLSFLETIT